jgi:non-homologous end joining protein Ku
MNPAPWRFAHVCAWTCKTPLDRRSVGDKGRGYEVAKGQYLIVDDAELEAIEIESSHTIEIDSFVPRA